MTPRTKDAGDRKDEVLRAAARLFHGRGYQGTSMDDIAQGVGLNKGTLYHYVDGKAGIVFEIYRLAQERALAAIRAIPDEADEADAVAQIVRIHLNAVHEEPDQTAVYFQEMHWIEEWLDPEQVEVLRANERAYFVEAKRIVESGIARGVFQPTDAFAVIAGFVGIGASAYQWYDPDGPYTVDEIAEVFCRMVLDGVVDRREQRLPAR